MSTLFTELFQGNVSLDTEKRIELVRGLEEFLVFDNLFAKEEIVPADFASVLNKYGWFWVSCGPEQLVVNDITVETDTKNAQLSYYDTRKGAVAQINFTDFVAKVRATNPAEELEYAVVRLSETPAEGAKPKIPNPLQFYTTDLVNGKNRIQWWREFIPAVAMEEFLFWAKDAQNPFAERNTENDTFAQTSSLYALTDKYKEVMELGRLSQEYAHFKDLLDSENKRIKKGTPTLSADDLKLLKEQKKLAKSAMSKQAGKVPSRFSKEKLMKELIALTDDHPSNLRYLQRMLAYADFSKKLAWLYITDLDAWSAKFISFVMRESFSRVEAEFEASGLTALKKSHFTHFGFKFDGAHSGFFTEALVNRLNRDYSRPFWLYQLHEIGVEAGDIIVKARTEATLDFLSLMPKRVALSDSKWAALAVSQPSHSDVVVDFEEANGLRYAITVGGNTLDLSGAVNTVGRKKYLLDAEGKVQYEVDNANVGPATYHSAWAVIKIIDKQIKTDWNAANKDKVDVFEQLFGVKKKALGIRPKVPKPKVPKP